jgi:phospholipid/cholesterol/gamma-HCH transport system substrate-binding protein
VRELVSDIRRQVGWFVIIGIGAIVLILLMVGLRSDVFAKKFQLSFSPPSAAAFFVGQPVNFQGFTIGRIGDMSLKDNGQVHISLHLLERYHSMLHQGSKIHLIRDGLIGEQTVEITAGDTSKDIILDGQSIRFEATTSIEQLLQNINPAVDNANALLRELVVLAKWLNDPKSDIRQVTARMNEVSMDLNRQNVRKMVQSFADVLEDLQSLTATLQEHRVAEQLSVSLQATTQILKDLKPFSEQFAKQGPKSLELMNSLLGHVDKLSRSLDTVAGDLSELTPELPGLARESKNTIREMQDLLKQMQGSWLLGNDGGIKQGADPVAPPVLDLQP